MKHYITLLLTIVFITSGLHAQDWVVPEDQQSKLADFAFDDATIQAGENVYLINCKSCHGDPGKANYTQLNPLPSDPVEEKIQSNSDGELYYKIREGRSLMPKFKNILSAQQVWEVIAFIRSYNPDYVQEVAEPTTGSNNRWQNISITMSLLPDDNQIVARVSGLEGEAITAVDGAEVKLVAMRTFGSLLVDDIKTTDSLGLARFSAPVDLPGNPDGMVDLQCSLNDDESFGVVKTDTALAVGLPTTHVPLTDTRAMWSTVKKAPYWILLSYGLAVIAVWGLIFFIMFQLRAIFKIGEKQQTE